MAATASAWNFMMLRKGDHLATASETSSRQHKNTYAMPGFLRMGFSEVGLSGGRRSGRHGEVGVQDSHRGLCSEYLGKVVQKPVFGGVVGVGSCKDSLLN